MAKSCSEKAASRSKPGQDEDDRNTGIVLKDAIGGGVQTSPGPCQGWFEDVLKGLLYKSNNAGTFERSFRLFIRIRTLKHGKCESVSDKVKCCTLIMGHTVQQYIEQLVIESSYGPKKFALNYLR